MKKLIIIGNGFDLAHGYKTSYKDFIIWLVKKAFIDMNIEHPGKERRVTLPLFSCSINRHLRDFEEYLNKNIINIIRSSESKLNINILLSSSEVRDYSNYTPLSIKTDSIFASKILMNSCDRWVDIEETYYDCLKSILISDTRGKKEKKEKAIKELNTQLEYLCDKLKEYLLSIEQNKNLEQYRSIIIKDIDKRLLFTTKSQRSVYNYNSSDTYILNFNYTNTISQYLDGTEITVNQIHGSISDDNNPMIFGYGDELDTDFKTIENENTNGFLKHVKSLWYLRTSNYRDLIRFIESENYQVQIMGHSCGRSDRTLLNTIFEHENCNSVDIYYRVREDGTDNFNEITEDISRHFKDKQKLRRCVLHKNPMNILPNYTT